MSRPASGWPRRVAPVALGVGVGTLAAAAAVHATSLAGQMATHAAISVVAAPALVLAAGAHPALAEWARPALRRRGAPAACFAAFVAVHWMVHLGPGFADERSVVHPVGHVLVLVAALAFWAPLLGGVLEGRARLGGAAASLYLFLAMPAVDLVSVPLMGRGEAAAAATMLGGMLPLGVAALVITLAWVRGEERAERAREGEAAR